MVVTSFSKGTVTLNDCYAPLSPSHPVTRTRGAGREGSVPSEGPGAGGGPSPGDSAAARCQVALSPPNLS